MYCGVDIVGATPVNRVLGGECLRLSGGAGAEVRHKPELVLVLCALAWAVGTGPAWAELEDPGAPTNSGMTRRALWRRLEL